METDIHLDLARGLLRTLAGVLEANPVKAWSPAGVELAVSLLRLVRQALRHAATPVAAVPLLDRILDTLGRDRKAAALRSLVEELRADLAYNPSEPG
jgi:hypothetical protein